MRSKINIINSSDKYLLDVFKIIWSEKIIVLFTTVAFILLSFFYFSNKPKLLISEIVINSPPMELFQKYEIEISDNYKYLSSHQKFDIKKSNQYIGSSLIHSFYNSIKKNILSADNFSQFINDNKLFESFANDLKSKNLNEKNFFKQNFKQSKIKSEIIENTYSLIYMSDSKLNGQLLLNEYIEFTVKKTLADYKKRLKKELTLNISHARIFYNHTKKKILETPKNQMNYESMMNLNYNQQFMLSYYEKLIDDLQIENFNYQYILDKASNPEKVNNISKYTSLFMGLIFGLIFSIIIIFIKNQSSLKI